MLKLHPTKFANKPLFEELPRARVLQYEEQRRFTLPEELTDSLPFYTLIVQSPEEAAPDAVVCRWELGVDAFGLLVSELFAYYGRARREKLLESAGRLAHESGGTVVVYIQQSTTIKRRQVERKALELEEEGEDSSVVVHSIRDSNVRYDLQKLMNCDQMADRLALAAALGQTIQREQNLLNKLTMFKEWMLQEFPVEEHWRFICLGSLSLASHGIRRANDIDLYVHVGPKDRAFKKQLAKAFKNNPKVQNARFDCLIRGIGRWSVDHAGEAAVAELDLIFDEAFPKMLGFDSMEALITDPAHQHWYFGMRCISLEGDYSRRQCRPRPSALADLLYAQVKVGEWGSVEHARVPALPALRYEAGSWLPFSESTRAVYFSTAQNYLKKRYGLELEVEEIAELVGNGVDLLPFNYPVDREDEIVEAGGETGTEGVDQPSAAPKANFQLNFGKKPSGAKVYSV